MDGAGVRPGVSLWLHPRCQREGRRSRLIRGDHARASGCCTWENERIHSKAGATGSGQSISPIPNVVPSRLARDFYLKGAAGIAAYSTRVRYCTCEEA
jgi:hypothetical protein